MSLPGASRGSARPPARGPMYWVAARAPARRSSGQGWGRPDSGSFPNLILKSYRRSSPKGHPSAGPGGAQIVPPTRPPSSPLSPYGSLALPPGAEDEGPPGGLTLDQAIDRLIRSNMDLNSKSFEIPQAEADILT